MAKPDFTLSWYHFLAAKVITLVHYAKVSALVFVFFVTHPFQMFAKERAPPECLSDKKHGEHKYISVNGIKLHYVEKGDPSKPLMIFVHGFPEFWYSWRYQLQEFSKDYWCIALDNRGYGDSEKPDELEAYEVKNMVADMKELVLALGRKSCTMVGHDWGALLVWSFVDSHPEMIEKFVTMSGPSSRAWIKLVFSEWWQFTNSWYVFFFQWPFVPELTFTMNDLACFDVYMKKSGKNIPTVSDEDIEAYKYTFSKPGAVTPPINYYRANFMTQFPEKNMTAVPKGLFLLGEKDIYISKGCLPLLQNDYDGLKVQLIPDERHFIQQEAPEKVNKAIRDFLRE